MSGHNNALWQTIIFLFLSKLSVQKDQPFEQKLLINAKNINLAQRFAAMTGDTIAAKKTKLALLKALKQLEKTELILRIDENTIQLSSAGIATMATEVQTAMRKISTSFPASTVPDQTKPTIN